MASNVRQPSAVDVVPRVFGPLAPVIEYMGDAGQRSVLFWDVMRQRGNQARAHAAEEAPNVLDNKAEFVVDG